MTIKAEAQHYQPVSVTFPEENPAITAAELDLVDDDAVSQHLVSQLPVADLLAWLQRHYSHLSDATLLRLYHAFTQQNEWSISLSEQEVTCELKHINVIHYPQGVESIEHA